jgi:tetratricopeptide (TPR) repeat protein
MTNVCDKYMLGELLLQFGYLTEKELHGALTVASETRLPLGKVLVLSGLITETALEQFLRCQSLISKGSVSLELMRTAIKEVVGTDKTLDEALYKLGWDPTSKADIAALSELLIGCRALNQKQLEELLKLQAELKLPLGQVIISSEMVSEPLLTTALNLQTMLTEGKTTLPEAVAALSEFRQQEKRKKSIPRAKGFNEIAQASHPRLGELLVLAGFVSEKNIAGALELSLENQCSLGSTLVAEKLITPYELDAVLSIQEKICEGSLQLSLAKPVLVAIKKGQSAEEALAGINQTPPPAVKQNLSYGELLKFLGLIRDQEIEASWKIAQKNTQIMMEILAIGGALDLDTLERANECLELHHQGHDPQTIATLFSYAENRGIEIRQAAQELHLNPETETLLQETEMSHSPSEAEVLSVKQIADDLILKGDLKTAANLYRQLVCALKPNNDKHYRTCLESLVDILCRCEDYHNAEIIGQQLVDSAQKAFGTQHLSYGYALITLGKVYYFHAKFKEALKCTEEYVEVCSTCLGEGHSDVGCGWQNIGLLCRKIGDLAKSHEAYSKAFNICQKTLGPEHPSTRNLADKLLSLEPTPAAATKEKTKMPKAKSFTNTGSWKAIKITEENSPTKPLSQKNPPDSIAPKKNLANLADLSTSEKRQGQKTKD